MVVRPDFESRFELVVELETTRDFLPGSIYRLIDERFALAQFLVAQVQNQITVVRDLHFISAFKQQRDLPRIGPRRNDEIKFQLSPVAVINHVHAWINAFRSHLRERGNLRAPLSGIVADEIIHLAG